MNERGLTLIELMMALVILGLLAAVVTPSIENATGARVRAEAGRIAGVVRYVYGASALKGQTCRLVFDLEGHGYHAECAEGMVRITRPDDREARRAEEEADEEERERATAGEVSAPEEEEPADEAEAERRRIDKAAEFGAYADVQLPERDMPSGVSVVGYWAEGMDERASKGKARLYFFPSGMTQRARIWLSNDGGSRVYTLDVAPLTGRVQVHSGELEVPRS